MRWSREGRKKEGRDSLLGRNSWISRIAIRWLLLEAKWWNGLDSVGVGVDVCWSSRLLNISAETKASPMGVKETAQSTSE
jgi:hypothetical protein